jgi:putative tricarboxylic transport membrane protein
MLALAEVMVQIEEYGLATHESVFLKQGAKKEDSRVSLHEFRNCLKTILRSSLIGTGVGALPGIGATIAAFLGYGAAKRTSKNPEKFGKGELEGVAAAEAANNAVVGANLIPLFTLGIPGNVAAALLIGAFMIHGVTPGPLMFQEHGRLIYGIYGALIIANGLNLAVGNFGLRFFARVIQIRKQIVYPVIVICCVTGAYMADSSIFAVGLMIIFAILGYFMKKLDFSFVTFIIGFVLGPILELSLRQTLILSRNNPMILIQHPVSLIFLILTALSIWKLGFPSKKVNKKKRHGSEVVL